MTTLTGAFLAASPGAVFAEGQVSSSGIESTLLKQAAEEKPLDSIASALGEQGRGRFADIYTNVRIEVANGRVILYTTNLSRAADLIATAKRDHPDIETDRVSLEKAQYSKKELDARIQDIMTASKVSKGSDLSIYTVAPTPDGSSIQITAKAGTTERVHAQALGSSAGIPVTVTAGTPMTATEWRWNDAAPFIGGDVLVGPSRKPGYTASCTSSLAVEDNNGTDYLITATHCFPTGVSVYGNGGRVGDLNSVVPGNRIGRTTSYNTEPWDATLIYTDGLANGQGTNSDEADTPYGRWIPVDSVGYSYVGQSVCQDGARSYFTGHGVPCGIAVSNSDIWVNVTYDDGAVAQLRGVQGIAASGWAVTEGDSGGLVFSIEDDNTRQGRGSVTAESGNNVMFWTEAPDIMDSLGVHLNPHQ